MDALSIGKWSAGTGALIAMATSLFATRTVSGDFTPAEYGNQKHLWLLAYSAPVRAVEELGEQADPARVDVVAEQWISGYERGHLKMVPSVSYDDTCRDGVKQAILTAKINLGYYLIRGGKRALAEGDRAKAAARFVRAIEVQEIMKESDLPSVLVSSRIQIEGLNHLAANRAAMTTADRIRLSRLWDPSSYRDIARLLGNTTSLYSESEVGINWLHPYIDDALVKATGIMGSHPATDGEAVRQIRAYVGMAHHEGPSILFTARNAWTAQTNFQVKLGEMLQKRSEPAATYAATDSSAQASDVNGPA